MPGPPQVYVEIACLELGMIREHSMHCDHRVSEIGLSSEERPLVNACQVVESHPCTLEMQKMATKSIAYLAVHLSGPLWASQGGLSTGLGPCLP